MKHRGTEVFLPPRHREHRGSRSGVAAFDDGDFGGGEVLEFVDEVVDFLGMPYCVMSKVSADTRQVIAIAPV